MRLLNSSKTGRHLPQFINLYFMRKFFFKTCPKYGRILGVRQDTMFHKLLYPVIGLVALGWVIIRVLPKPSRASYPCQQAAIPVAVGFLAWLSATTI